MYAVVLLANVIWSPSPTNSNPQYVCPSQVADWLVAPLMKLFEMVTRVL